MENTKEFERWMFQMLADAESKLNMTDRTIAYILLREGTNYYFKTLTKSAQDSLKSE